MRNKFFFDRIGLTYLFMSYKMDLKIKCMAKSHFFYLLDFKVINKRVMQYI